MIPSMAFQLIEVVSPKKKKNEVHRGWTLEHYNLFGSLDAKFNKKKI